MHWPQIPSIETERLLLRPPKPSDLAVWTARIFADPAVTRFIPSRITDPHERARAMLTFIIDNWTQRGYGEWLVNGKSDGQLMGHCGLAYVAETSEVEFDYALATPYWGQGFATEAAHASLRFGFEQAGLESIIGLAVPEHVATRRVLAHVGFVYQHDALYFGHTLAYHTLLQCDFRSVDSLYRLHIEQN